MCHGHGANDRGSATSRHEPTRTVLTGNGYFCHVHVQRTVSGRCGARNRIEHVPTSFSVQHDDITATLNEQEQQRAQSKEERGERTSQTCRHLGERSIMPMTSGGTVRVGIGNNALDMSVVLTAAAPTAIQSQRDKTFSQAPSQPTST